MSILKAILFIPAIILVYPIVILLLIWGWLSCYNNRKRWTNK